MSRLLPTLLLLGLTVYALIDCLQTPAAAIRNLPKSGWVVVIVFVVAVGPVAWLFVGRPRDEATGTPAARPQPRPTAPGRPVAPDDDADFLRSLDRARSRERDAQLERWEEELRRRDEPGDAEDDPPR